jgi:hypothetical protein
VTWQLARPSETVTVPGGQTVPLAGVTDTCTSSVVPMKPGVCVVPVIVVVVATAVPARAADVAQVLITFRLIRKPAA